MRSYSLDGWQLFFAAGFAIAAITLGAAWLDAFSSESLRWGIRFTARTSAVLFLLVFTASAAARVIPSSFTRWQRANRRYLGLSFAFSHFVHAIVIVAFASKGPEQYAHAVTPDMVIVGSIGYALIILMAATSFKATAAMIGAKAWSVLHNIGVHWLWLQFVVAFGVRAKAGGLLYWSFIAVFMLVLGLRLVAWRKKRAGSRLAA